MSCEVADRPRGGGIARRCCAARSVERDLDDELRAYLEASTDELVRAGMTPEDGAGGRHARRWAASRRSRITPATQAGSPGSTGSGRTCATPRARCGGRRVSLASPATLTLAIGGTTAIFQLADAVRLRPLPVINPEEILEIRTMNPERGRMGTFSGRRPLLTYPLWQSCGNGSAPSAASRPGCIPP